MGMPSSIELRRFEPSLGKCTLKRWVYWLWSLQIKFIKISSKFKTKLPSNVVTKQDRGIDFGIDFPSVILGLEMIQNPPQQ